MFTTEILNGLTRIPQYEYHILKNHIFINPDRFHLAYYTGTYDSLEYRDYHRFRRDHKIHVFISWMTSNDVIPMIMFLRLCHDNCDNKIIIHIPKSVDDITYKYIKRTLKDIPANAYKVYIEKDSSHTMFNWGRSGNTVLDVYSIYNHKYKATIISRKGEQ